MGPPPSNNHSEETLLVQRMLIQEEHLRDTLEEINRILMSVSSTLERTNDTLKSTTKIADKAINLAETTKKQISGYLWMARGAFAVVGITVALLCFILLEKNKEISKLTDVALSNQTELAAERGKRDQQWDITKEELMRHSAADVSSMQALIQALAKDHPGAVEKHVESMTKGDKK